MADHVKYKLQGGPYHGLPIRVYGEHARIPFPKNGSKPACVYAWDEKAVVGEGKRQRVEPAYRCLIIYED